MTDITNDLEHLYTRLIDSRDGYERASEDADSSALKRVFQELHALRADQAAALRGALASSGADLDDDGSLLAAAHRAFLDLRDMLSGGDDAVIAEVIRGERTLLNAYNDLIEDIDGTHPAYDMLTDQHQRLEAHIERLERQHDIAA